MLVGGYAGLGARSHAARATQYRTQVGQRARITLADGSRVILAPRTTLSVPSEFGGDMRTVTLDGEAYFDVSHMTGAPFVVRTGAVEARVLGTAFSVRRYDGDRVAHVAVVTGKIALSAVRSPSTRITLTSGAVGEANDSSAQLAPNADPAQYTAWTRGRLVFHQTPVSDVLISMTRWYGTPSRGTGRLTDNGRHVGYRPDCRLSSGALPSLPSLR